MAGLLAVSWAPDREELARRRFARARDAFTSIKGLACNSEAGAPGFRMARLASHQSACPDVLATPEVVCASAGWWFDPDRAVGEGASLEALAGAWDQGRVLDRLQGQYLVVHHDATNGRTTASGDRLGLFPVYVAQQDGVAFLSTSAVALAAALGSRIDPQAIAALFMGGAIRSPRSAFEGIRRLSMGEQVTMSSGRLAVDRVWIPFRPTRSVRRIEDAAEEGIAILARTCSEIRRRWPRWVADLTSGLDSRLVLAAMSAAGPVNTTVNGSSEHIDVRISSQIAETLGWSLHRHDKPADWGARRWSFFRRGVELAEGELDGASIDGTVEAKLSLQARFDAALSGSGGELLRDFFWQQEFFWKGRTSRLDIRRLMHYRFFFYSVPDAQLFQTGWQREYLDDQERQAQKIVDWAPDALNTAKLDAIYLWKSSGHMGRYQGAVFPLIICPIVLATSRLVEYSVSLPWRFRLDSRLVRHMITRLNPRLAALPTCYGGSAQPLSVRRPGELMRYGRGATEKLIRKLGQVTIGHPILRDSTLRPPDLRSDQDLVTALERDGFLDADNLRTKDLYRADELRRFLETVRRRESRLEGPLSALVSAECLARLAADPQAAGDFTI